MTRPPAELRRDELVVHNGATDKAASLAAEVVPEQLLSGGEIVLFAIKPSLWFIPLVSSRWIAALLFAWAATRLEALSSLTLPLLRLAIGVVFARLVFATLQWSGRLYLLTDRRVLLIRGVLNVDIFECALTRIQNTWVTLSFAERLLRLGSIHMSTAAASPAAGSASWRIVARPLEVHDRLRAAIARAQHRDPNGV